MYRFCQTLSTFGSQCSLSSGGSGKPFPVEPRTVIISNSDKSSLAADWPTRAQQPFQISVSQKVQEDLKRSSGPVVCMVLGSASDRDCKARCTEPMLSHFLEIQYCTSSFCFLMNRVMRYNPSSAFPIHFARDCFHRTLLHC